MNQASDNTQENIQVSVYIITLNEAGNIGRLLEQLRVFDEVVIVDSGSDDGTQEIARQFHNVKLYHRDWTGFSDQKNYARTLCSNKWVLNLDADEALGNGYLEAMKELMQSNRGDALLARRVLYRKGRRPKSFFKDDVLVRFFRKNCGYYDSARVHEKLNIVGNIIEFDAELDHFEDLSFGQRIRKSNQYSQLKAQDKFEQGKNCNILILLVIFPMSFLRCYLLKGCFLDGCEGVLTSVNHAFYNFMKYAKLWELHRDAQYPGARETHSPCSAKVS